MYNFALFLILSLAQPLFKETGTLAMLHKPICHPLCPYPLIARYNGQGDSEKAENFSCK
ncbi:tannase and feruloyl esterase family protein [Acinetobacter sp. 1000160]|nr:tannase and feruloyl esterase family protein [Acinetobacter baumannii 146457]EYT22506.1 tannase and feruloyl esterase family protein [Acinetobacter sp. 1000160]